MALWYLTAECNYGGKVTDDKDRRLLLTLLKEFYSAELVDNLDHNLLKGSEAYKLPIQDSYEEFIAHIDTIPLITEPGLYGFHQNASITKEINETNLLIDTLILTQGAGATGGSGDNSKVFFLFFLKKLDYHVY